MDANNESWNLLWAVQRSSRYHARRQAFFDRWHRVTAGVGVIFGSAAAVNLVTQGGMGWTLGAAFVITILSSVDLVVGTSVMARLHSDLRRRFLEMEASIRCSPTADQADINRWTVERLRIEADEPPVYVALDLLCENEMSRAKGDSPRAALRWWEALTAHWWRWEDIDPRVPSRPVAG